MKLSLLISRGPLYYKMMKICLKIHLGARVIHDPFWGYFTKGRFDGSICRKGKWSIPQPTCETCAMPEIQSRPGLDSMCAVSARNGRMTCKIQCTNGGKIFGKISRPIACKCHNKNGCHWMFTGKGMRREDKHKVDLDALERICPRPEKPNPPPGTRNFSWKISLVGYILEYLTLKIFNDFIMAKFEVWYFYKKSTLNSENTVRFL